MKQTLTGKQAVHEQKITGKNVEHQKPIKRISWAKRLSLALGNESLSPSELSDEDNPTKDNEFEPIYKFLSEQPRASPYQKVMNELYKVSCNDKKKEQRAKSRQERARAIEEHIARKLGISAKPLPKQIELLSMKERRELLNFRLQIGKIDASIFKDIVDPKTIPRVENAIKSIDQQIILQEGAKYYDEKCKSQMVLQFLNICEKPSKYSYFDRYQKQKTKPELVGENPHKKELELLMEQRFSADHKIVTSARRFSQIKSDTLIMPETLSLKEITEKAKKASEQELRQKLISIRKKHKLKKSQFRTQRLVSTSLDQEAKILAKEADLESILAESEDESSHLILHNEFQKSTTRFSSQISFQKPDTERNNHFWSQHTPLPTTAAVSVARSRMCSTQMLKQTPSESRRHSAIEFRNFITAKTPSMCSSRKDTQFIESLKQINGHRQKVVRQLQKIGYDIQTKILNNSYIPTSKASQKFNTNKIIESLQMTDNLAIQSEYNWKNRSWQLMNMREKLKILSYLRAGAMERGTNLQSSLPKVKAVAQELEDAKWR